MSSCLTILALAVVLFSASPGYPEVNISRDSQPGDFIGGGQQRVFTPANGTFTVSRNFDNGVTITFNGGNLGFWSFDFAAPFNGTLVPGAYEDATRFPFQSPAGPGLNVSGDGRGCNTLRGRFVVLYATYSPSGDVMTFGADFEQHCESAMPALFGQIRFNPALLAAVLPAGRAVQAAGGVASAFATMLNPGTTDVTNCGIFPTTSVPGTFLYQTTDPDTNQLVGTANTRVAIAAGARKTFYFAFTLGGILSPTDVHLYFVCDTDFAPVVPGLNTLFLSASTIPGVDVIALAVTIDGNGIVDIPGTSGTGFFAAASANVGAPGVVTVSADTGDAPLPLTLTVCQTDSQTGACLETPTASVTVPIEANATPTFSVFAKGSGTVIFNPATNRIFLRFKDASGLIRGITSVAVRTH